MSKCWYCNNELTTGDNPKHFGICNKCYIIPKNLHNISICEVISKTREMILEDAEQYAEKHNLQNYIILIQGERLIDAYDKEGKYFEIDICIKSF